MKWIKFINGCENLFNLLVVTELSASQHITHLDFGTHYTGQITTLNIQKISQRCNMNMYEILVSGHKHSNTYTLQIN